MTAADLELPGGAGRTAERGRVRRGVGFAVSIKNLMYGGGFDDYSTARCRLEDGVATITCAAVEVGQGFVTLAQQIARDVLGVVDVVLAPPGTSDIGSAGSTSASRQTWMSGGAVQSACLAVRERLLASVASRHAVARETLDIIDGRVVSLDGEVGLPVAEAAPGEVLEETVEFHHAPTEELDANGQGDAFVSFAFAAHRAVVDVDLDLGLVRVVEIATSQDVGRVLNPVQLRGPVGRRHRPGPRARRDGGDRPRPRPGAESLLYRLCHPHRPRHAPRAHRGADRRAGARIPDGRQGRRRAADDLLSGRRGGRDPGRHRAGAPEGAGAPPGHRARRLGSSAGTRTKSDQRGGVAVSTQVAVYLQDAHAVREGMEIARYAESKGFHAIWQAESRLVREATVPMAAFLAVTERIKVGSGVVNNWTRNPALLASTFSTLDDLAPVV